MTRKAEIRFALSVLAAFSACAAIVAPAQTEPPEQRVAAEPAAVVEGFLDALVGAARLGDVHARFDILDDAVIASHDLDYIGQLTVRRQWREWDEAARSAFLAAFVRLSVMNYAVRFADVNESSFDIVAAQPAGNGRVQVNTTVLRSDAAAVPIDFVLQHDATHGWRIANVVADGVSDLALKRAEYRTLLSEDGFEGLLQALGEQADALLAESD